MGDLNPIGTPVSSGGFNIPALGRGGFINQPQGIPHYQGTSVIKNIPNFQRDPLGRATIHMITEGRPTMMQLLFDKIRKGGSPYVVDDIMPSWYLKYKPNERFYLKVKANQGGTTNTATSEGSFILDDPNDAARLQKGDLLACQATQVKLNRDGNAGICDYVAETGTSNYYLVHDEDTPMPEIVEVIEVNYQTGKITCLRNQGGDSQTADYTGKGFEVIATPSSGLANPGDYKVRQEDAFLMKVGNSIAETEDDQLIWSLSQTWDYNYVQRVMRKWGSNDMEEKIKKRGDAKTSTYNTNGQDAINAFWSEMEWNSLLNFRKATMTARNKYRGFAGGLFERIPSENVEVLYEPNYADYKNKPGSFNIPYFNYIFRNKVYYGGSEKFLICGERFHTAFATMINYMTQNVPEIRGEWSVFGHRFKTSQDLIVNVVVSDKMSLNNFSDRAILWDPSTMQYGYLGEDIKVVSPLPSTNIHVQNGEIFGDITYKYVNMKANHMFVLKPNNES